MPHQYPLAVPPVAGGLTFVVGAWLVRTPEPARPLPWLADWQERVLAPLADNALTCASCTTRWIASCGWTRAWMACAWPSVAAALATRAWQVEGELGLRRRGATEPAAGIRVAAWQRASH